MFTAGYGGLTHFIMGNVDLILAGGILAGSIMGSPIGVRISAVVGAPLDITFHEPCSAL